MGKDFRRVVRRVIRRLQMLPQFLAEIPQGLRGMESRLEEMRTELDELNVSIKSTDRKMLYAAVGQALSAWGKMEEHLVAIAALLLRASTEKSGLILYSIINFNVWLTLIGDLYEMDGALSPFQKRWNRISQRIREIKDKRDQLAHHSVQMGGSDIVAENPARLAAPKFDVRKKTRLQQPMRLNEVVSLSNSITDISDDLYNLLRDMMAAIEASKEESA